SVQQKCTAKKILKPNQQVAACKNELDILLVLSRSDRVYSEAYKTKKQEYTRLLSDATSAHYEERMNNSGSKSKCVWQIVREINGTVTEYVDQTSNISGKPENICNNFNKFVLHAGPNLIKTQPQATFSCSIPYNTKSFFLIPVTISEILNIISKLKNKKSAGYDGISANLLKHCAEEIAEPLCHIINNSFKYRIFHNQL
uniref:Uncharacterized protein LOC114348043 n=1 Tax=Diabrotica virgifera virgifera TaxID=50390 RepID=A0A6P7HFF7_DIAVI